MEKRSYSSIDTNTGYRISDGWLKTRTQTIREQIFNAKRSFSGKHSRASVFRFYIDFTKRAIGDEWICHYSSGDNRGRDKDSTWGILFWMPHANGNDAKLHIALMQVNARHYLDSRAIFGPTVLAEVTDHAVMRTICRMAKEGDISYDQMCAELQSAAEQLLPLFFARIQALNESKNIDCPELIVPTPSGAVTVRVVDSPSAVQNGRRRILFTTWLSDNTMQNQAQLHAIQVARAKGSILLDDGRTGTLLSPFASAPDAIRARISYDITNGAQ